MTSEIGVVPVTRNAANELFYQLPSPYKLSGPYVDVSKPDPKLIIDVAKHAGYPIGNTYPGLVLIIGSGGYYGNPHEMFMVGFDGDHRFVFASSPLYYCATVGELCHFLRNNPVTPIKP